MANGVFLKVEPNVYGLNRRVQLFCKFFGFQWFQWFWWF